MSAPTRFTCKSCGAELIFSPEKKGLLCDHCGAGQPLPAVAGFTAQEHPLAFNAAPVTELPAAAEDENGQTPQGFGLDALRRKCKQCAADFEISAGHKTASCPFCGSKFVEDNPAGSAVETPESLVPLAVGKGKARELFTGWLGKGFFTPGSLKSASRLDSLHGFYLPAWTFDVHTQSSWSADRGHYYYTNESYTDSNGRRQTRQVRHTRWESASGSRRDFYDDLLVPAARADLQSFLDEAGDFNLKAGLVAYAPGYLAGWGALVYAVGKAEAWKTAQARVEADQDSKCGADVGGDTHRDLNVNVQYHGPHYKHTLLPYWLCSYTYHGKLFQFVINGQTGKIAGSKPLSWIKICFVILLALVAIGLVIWLSQS